MILMGTLAIGTDVPLSIQKAFYELKKEGHLLFTCTGRPYEYASQFFQQYVDGFIASNGRYVIYRNKVL